MNQTLNMMESTTLNMMENITLNMTATPEQDLCMDWSQILPTQMLFFGFFYLLLPAYTMCVTPEPLTLKTKLVTFTVLWTKAFTIMYHVYLLTSCDGSTGVLHAIIDELCSCLTFVLPLVLFTHIWNPALMNPIATVGDRVTIMFVFLNLLMSADQTMVVDVDVPFSLTVYNIPISLYTYIWIIAFAYLASWITMMPTPHEFREIGRNEKLFSIFDLCSMMTSAVLSLSMCAVFILVILFADANLNLLFFLLEMLKVLSVLFVLIFLCPKINEAIKDASKLPTNIKDARNFPQYGSRDVRDRSQYEPLDGTQDGN